MNDKSEKIRLSTIEISDYGISEFDNNIRTVHIPKSQINKVVLGFGSAAEYPIRTTIVSIILVIVGLTFGLFIYQILFVNESPSNGAYSGIGILGSGATSFLLGIWVFSEIYKKRYYLNVTTNRGNRKVIFQDKYSFEEIRMFINKTNIEHGYAIDYDLSLKRDQEKR